MKKFTVLLTLILSLFIGCSDKGTNASTAVVIKNQTSVTIGYGLMATGSGTGGATGSIAAGQEASIELNGTTCNCYITVPNSSDRITTTVSGGSVVTVKQDGNRIYI